MANRYWVGNSGNWSDNVNHWSDVSGGAPGASLPTSADNVYFDANSFTLAGQTVTIDMVASCKDMDWTGILNNPQLNFSYNLLTHGNVTLSPALSMGVTTVYFSFASGGVQTLKTNGAVFTSRLNITGGTQLSLLDDFSSTITGTAVRLYQGTLNTNGYNINTINGSFDLSSTSVKVLNLSSSVITCGGAFNVGTNLTLSAGTSTIKLTGNNITFAGGGLTYNNVEFLGTPTTITDSNAFNKLTVGASKTLKLTTGTTQTVNDLAMEASSVLQSSTAGVNANLVMNGVTVTPLGSGVTKTDVTVTTPNAPANKRYWVGNGGNWSDTAHWSVFSGFFSGATVPTSADSVYFDANSFRSAGQTVTVDTTANCLDMDWTGALYNPTFTSSGTRSLNVYGSLTYVSMMSLTGTIYIYLRGTAIGKTITTSGKSVYGMYVQENGEWTLQDNLTTSALLSLVNGILNTNGKTLNCTIISMGALSTLTLGESTINCAGNFSVTAGATINAGTSTIKLTGNNITFAGAGLAYNDVEFLGTPITVTGSNAFNILTVGASKTLNLTAGTTQTVSDLVADGATIQSATLGATTTISKDAGTVELSGTAIKDVAATGGATFRVIEGTNNGNNSGFIWVLNAVVAITNTVLVASITSLFTTIRSSIVASASMFAHCAWVPRFITKTIVSGSFVEKSDIH